LREVRRVPYWLDRPEPVECPHLEGFAQADLVIVGGGFTGLWAALLASEAHPDRAIVLLEGERIGHAATGRNGGFVAASLTHGVTNGLQRWPKELPTLVRLGMDNLDAIESTVTAHSINCDWQRTGEVTVAVDEHHVHEEQETLKVGQSLGLDVQWLDQQAMRQMVNSPTYLGGVWDRRGVAMVDPVRLAWGLRRVCLERGIHIYENSRVSSLTSDGSGLSARTSHGRVRAAKALIATGCDRALARQLRRKIAPVYDYVLMTEPLTESQRSAIGWQIRVGVGDAGNLFHYYRTTVDGRILWGGYDAIHQWRSRVGPEYDVNVMSWAKLADHFVTTFPQLEGVAFSHAWGGAIDTCTRFAPFWGTTLGGRAVYVGGYTGLGVGSSRFGAATALDVLYGEDTERTRLEMVRRQPIAFPPEPARSVGIRLMTRSLERADHQGGKRNLLLRMADAVGFGFDS
jgi:glycine/D-amino acid oxidase-like deaminating enzyme